MAEPPTTYDMGFKHDTDCARMFGGVKTRSSGNQFNDPLDGKHLDGEWAFGWDGKSTVRKSLSIGVATWEKIVEQAHDLRPMMPLRFYAPDDNRLRVVKDLVVLDAHDMAEIIEELRGR